MTGGPTVSLCLIARDEEHCLASCLDSVRSLVQEIVVVDTGSTDRTVEVAASRGARVFTYPWAGDFASARNYSLALARGQWVLVLDADEILAPVSPQELSALLSAPGVEGYFVTIRNYLGRGETVAEDRVVRLFKNNPAYRFTGAIHEQVAGSIMAQNGGGGLACSGLVIHHRGYLQRQLQTRDKHRRNIGIIRRALEKQPADPFLLYSLGIEYCRCGETAGGIEQLEKALMLVRGHEGYFHDLLVLLCAALLKAGNHDRLKTVLEGSLCMFPSDPDLLLIKEACSRTVKGEEL
ncbi:MAG TPA: glycosyltransferase family 2 protein [Desulfotomaculum sp.]|nr:glycosyltransferase family 2 protein [Desulfotomaculum sp.]